MTTRSCSTASVYYSRKLRSNQRFSKDMVRAWREAGVVTVRLYPSGDTLPARLDTLARGINLVRAL